MEEETPVIVVNGVFTYHLDMNCPHHWLKVVKWLEAGAIILKIEQCFDTRYPNINTKLTIA